MPRYAKVGRINYLSFASMFNERAPQKTRLTDVDELVGQHIRTTIWANDVVLCKAFRCFDADGSGCLAPAVRYASEPCSLCRIAAACRGCRYRTSARRSTR
jgi:hypothetical protein